jgi:tetratricopeptide (TPR) repeat protein
VADSPELGGEGRHQRRRRPGRPPKAQDASASALAALGVRLRELRQNRGLTLMQLAELTGYSWQHLGAVERGQVVPSENVVSACDACLQANGALITLLSAVIREQAHIRHQHEAARRPVRRASVRDDQVAGRAKLVCDDDLDWDRLADASRRPSRITPAVVEDLELITDRQRRLYHELSSAEMLVHVQAHFGLLTSFLDWGQPDPLRHRLASAVAEAAGFAAWLWFDLGDAFSMERSYRQARDAADEATDRGVGAYIKGYQGMVSAQREGPAAGLAHLDEARGIAPRSLSGVTRSWLTVLAADAMARTGQRKAALTALGRSRDFLASAREDEREPWMYEFGHGSLAVHAGTCYLALGQPHQAANAFEEALALLPPSCDRRGATIETGLAHARLAAGDVEEAQRLASSALVVFAERGSVAGLRRIRDLRNTFRDAGHHHAAAALDEHARALQAPTG